MEQSWTLADLADALDRYAAEAEASALTVSTKQTYVSHARRFVGWLDGGYQFPPEGSPGRHRAP